MVWVSVPSLQPVSHKVKYFKLSRRVGLSDVTRKTSSLVFVGDKNCRVFSITREKLRSRPPHFPFPQPRVVLGLEVE